VTPTDRRGTLALVPPRYGPGVVGGAEAVFAELARGLAGRGWQVEILTTCARDHYTWANEYPAGTSKDDQLTVHRFPTVMDTPGRHRTHLGNRLLSGQPLTVSEQQLWINDSLRVPDLWHHVLDHADDYRAIVLGPYMFWTTYAVGQIRPERTFLIPCLHREAAASLDIYRPLVEGARGIFFLSEPERDLAGELFRLPQRHEVVGSGIALPHRYDAERFCADHGIDGPFVYYAGRREWAKGWTDLVEAFREVREVRGADLRLVTSGAGDAGVASSGLGDALIDVGFLSDADRDAAMAAAAAYVQPSAMESFSRTVLEAWGAGTPVIANADSEVVAWHVERSGAGVLYRGTAELVEALSLLDAEPGRFAALAAGGRRYVEEHYDPERVLDRFETLIDDWSDRP
jgi:glycosyltransferase involved in cell wall biosynthesis